MKRVTCIHFLSPPSASSCCHIPPLICYRSQQPCLLTGPRAGFWLGASEWAHLEHLTFPLKHFLSCLTRGTALSSVSLLLPVFSFFHFLCSLLQEIRMGREGVAMKLFPTPPQITTPVPVLPLSIRLASCLHSVPTHMLKAVPQFFFF